MRRGVTSTKTTLAADEILQCHCRAGESWPADCSKAAVQQLQSSGRRTACWSVGHHVSMTADRSRRGGDRDELTVIDKVGDVP